MLVNYNRLIGTPILSMQAADKIATIDSAIIDPDSLKIVAFRLAGPLVDRSITNLLDITSIREYSRYGMVIDSADELVEKDDVVKIAKAIELDFKLIDIKVETKKGTKLGKVSDYTVTDDNFTIKQLIVKRPMFKSFLDSDLIIPRQEIIEVNDDKIIVKDEEKVIRSKAEKEDFIPNFVNPFRKSEQDLAPVDTKNPAGTNIE